MDELFDFTIEDLEAQVDKNAKGEFRLGVSEIRYAAGDKPVRKVLDGQGIETAGQIATDPDHTDRLIMFRAYPVETGSGPERIAIGIQLKDQPPEYKELGWYRVTGKITYLDEDGVVVPVLEATTLVEIAELNPDATY